ncbi:uncharacterized protein ARMOST_20520 [Armillaria ostoyae]|uniref:Uncharacterized protein n=1 Tax=Armillaria ostoyae TaxID=47428 RepID=A0A284S7J8_ARMOS|nr:uncharacterized protein ARMOST_20520 [Armillaria ostoyae]
MFGTGQRVEHCQSQETTQYGRLSSLRDPLRHSSTWSAYLMLCTTSFDAAYMLVIAHTSTFFEAFSKKAMSDVRALFWNTRVCRTIPIITICTKYSPLTT